MGDGIHVCDIEKYKETHFAQEYAELLNTILGDDAIYELVARRLEKNAPEELKTWTKE